MKFYSWVLFFMKGQFTAAILTQQTNHHETTNYAFIIFIGYHSAGAD